MRNKKLVDKVKTKVDIEALKKKPWWRVETALLAGALVCGMGSGILSSIHEKQSKEQMSRLYSTSYIYTAASSINEGTILQPAHLKRSAVLMKNISKNMVTPRSYDLVIGHRLKTDLLVNDPVLLTAVEGGLNGTSVVEKIPPGKRLFTLSVSDTNLSYGFIRPNHHVDILAHIDLPDRGLTTFTVLEDVTVISVGANTIGSESKAKGGATISFFVDAKDMELLSFAQKKGEFSLSLRNGKDLTKLASRRGVDMKDFLDNKFIHKASGGTDLEVTIKGKKKK